MQSPKGTLVVGKQIPESAVCTQGTLHSSDMTQFFLRQLFPRDKTEREGEN